MQLIDTVIRAHSRFIVDADFRAALDGLLFDLLSFMDSQWGWVVEMSPAQNQVGPFKPLLGRALDPHGNGHTQAAIDFKSCDIQALLQRALDEGKPVMENQPRRLDWDEVDEPALVIEGLLIVPLQLTGPFVGVLILAKRAGSFEQAVLETLQPLFLTMAQLIAAQRQRLLGARDCHLLDSVLEAATEFSVIATDKNGLIKVFNRGSERLLGYRADEMINIQTPALLHLPSEMQQYGLELSARFGYPVEGFRVFVEVPERCGFERREWHYVRKDGSQFLVSLTITAMRDENGQITGYLGIAENISEDRARQLRLKESEERLELALKGGDLGLWDWHIPSGRVVFNERWCNLLGYTVAEIPQHVDSWNKAVHPEDWPIIKAALQTHLQGVKDYYECEHRLRHKDGHWLWVLDRGRVVERDACGAPIRAVGTHLDLSERKRLQERLDNIVRHVPGLVYQYKRWPDGHVCFTYLSSACQKLYGVEPQAGLADFSAVFKHIHPDDGLALAESSKLSAQLLTPWHNQHRVIQADGTILWLEGNSTPEAQADGSVIWHGYVHDITALKQSEAALLQTTEQLKEAQRIARFGSWKLDFEHNQLSWSAQIFEIFELEATQFQPSYEAFLAAIHPDDRATVDAAYRNSLQCRQPYEITHRLLMHDGRVKYVHEHCETRFDAQGQPLLSVGTIQDVTERVVAKRRVDELLTRLQKIASMVPGMVYQYQRWPDGRTAFPYASEGINHIYGVSPEAVVADAAPVLQVIHPDDREHVEAIIQASARTLSPWHDEYRAKFPDGRVIWLEGEAMPEALDDGSVLWHGHIRDITERKLVEEQLRQSASVFEHANEGIIITDPSVRIIDVNQAFTRITGYSREEVLGKNPRLLSSGHHPPKFYAAMWRELNANDHWSGEVWDRRKNGEMYAEILTISAVRNDKGQIQRYVALFSDITFIKEHQKQLEYLAHYDALTHLPNRVLLVDRLHQAMVQTQRHHSVLGLAYLDLDGFKTINDSHGHEVGDRLLTLMAGRMKEALRDGDTLARLGGDEFVVTLLDLPNHEASLPVLERLLRSTAEPLYLDDLELRVSASVGVTFFPQYEAAVDADQLLRQADQAMYQAKQLGKNRYHIFDSEQERAVRDRHESIELIRQALANNEFVLHYQPKVNMRTGKVIGVEALIRWQHPERGLLSPAWFLPLIENHRLVVDLGKWVLATALDQFDAWRRQGLSLPISVNINPLHLQQTDFVEHLRGELGRHPAFSPGDLELEVLESSALEDIAQATKTIKDCREMGVSFSVDDFGTGYSSLSYLKRLPVQVLKIDQSFVRDMLEDPDDLALLDGVLGLASAFRRRVIAEGVETPVHGEMLLQLGCEFGQGYAIARPMPAESVMDWVAQWRPAATWTGCQRLTQDCRQVLFEMVQLRAWVSALARHLQDGSESPLDDSQSNFSLWLREMGAAQSSPESTLGRLHDLHEKLLQQAAELLGLKQQGQITAARQRLDDIMRVRDALLDDLKQLLEADA